MSAPALKLVKQPQTPAVAMPGLESDLAAAAAFVRKHVIASIYRARCGHLGSALSCADLLACLYGAELNCWPSSIGDSDRDRFVLSKGHAAPALYAAGAYYEFCDVNTALGLHKPEGAYQNQPHVDDAPWIEASSGSLGQGFSVALGMAMGLKLQGSTARVYTLLGDGELQEGEVWEAAMCAAHHALDNLCAIVDYNKLQNDDSNAAIMRLEPLAAKWRAFDWAVAEIDGHDIAQILSAFRRASSCHGRPTMIIAHTVKGKGVASIEDASHWPGNGRLTRLQAEEALKSLGATQDEIAELLHGHRH